ncbi:hypothetical protein FOC1_g10014653 [Fusarium oxysporum f. sp. cubense race 1]|uniref:Uncharacterized protein n=1 Tax=Fusarium oxysporum f. sp. cubense (strain race 1) TaxID=1229664 RepID=N4TZ11_FUSC1|nr:hypothetical protein FOC1_g10014653 [Fusarium oxysporum f. sp. cubense race 1]
MALPSITVSSPKTTSESPMTRAATSPIEWDHYYSGARFSENRDIAMNGPQGGEYDSVYDVEEEGLDENFVYGRLSPVPAPRQDTRTLSNMNGCLPGYRFVGNRDIEMDKVDLEYESSFHEFTFEHPFRHAEDFEGFSGCWYEDDYEADVSESCFEESSEEYTDNDREHNDMTVEKAVYTVPRRLSNMEDTNWGLRKRKFDEYEEGQIEEDEFYEDESDDVQIEEPYPEVDDDYGTLSDDDMCMEHVLECGVCSDLDFNSTDTPQDHENSPEAYTFQDGDVEFEEFPQRLPTILEVDEPTSPFPPGYADYVPEDTYVDGCFGVEDEFYPDEAGLPVEEEGKDYNGPYFNDA